MQNPFEQKDTFLYSPAEPAAAAPETPAAASAAVSTPSETSDASATSGASSATTSTPSTSASDSSSSTPAAASAPAPAAPSWLDGFKNEGVSFTDEKQAQAQLLQSYRDAERLRPLAPALSAYQANAQKFHQWLNEQNKQAPATPASQEDWTKKAGWNHPEWNPAWEHMIVRDEKGNLSPAPGAPADIVLKYQQAQQFRKEFAEQFLTNPAKTLEPYIRHVAQEIASQQSQQGVGQLREQQEANEFITKHSNWLFEAGQDGAPKSRQVINPQTGRYESEKVLSNWGQMFVQNLQDLAKEGLPPKLQEKYAMQAVQNAYMASPEYIAWAAQQGKPVAPAASGTPREQANQKFVQNQNPAVPPTKPSQGNSKAAPRTVTRDNMESIMLERFREAGVQL